MSISEIHLKSKFSMLVFFKDSSSLMHTDVLPAYVYVHCRHAWCPQRPEGGIVSPGTSVTADVSCREDAGN